MGRWAWNDFVQLTNNNGLPGVAGNYRYGSKANKENVVVDSVVTITPTTLLNIRASMNHWVGDFKPYVPFDSLGFGFPKSPGQSVAAAYCVPVDLDRRRHHDGPVLRE